MSVSLPYKGSLPAALSLRGPPKNGYQSPGRHALPTSKKGGLGWAAKLGAPGPLCVP